LERRGKRSLMTKYGVRKLIEIANKKANPDLNTFDGVEQALVNWYCNKYSVSEVDPVFDRLTLEELMVMYQKERILQDPIYYQEKIGKVDDYETWLQKEMGENYITNEEQKKIIEEDSKKLEAQIKEKYPDKVTTDFTNLKE
jgi:hypothetical protein